MSFLRCLISLFGSIFKIFGHIWSAISWMVRPILETFGFADPIPQQTAASEAEAALARSQSHSSLDRRSVYWTPEQKLKAVVAWCEWRIGRSFGPEPTLAGLSIREKLKLRAADDYTLTVLPQRTLAQIENWMQSPKKVLEPLSDPESEEEHAVLRLGGVQPHARRNQLKHDAELTNIIAETDNVLKQVEEVLSSRPGGLAFS